VTKIILSPEPDDFPNFFEGWGDDQFSIALRDGIRNGIDRALNTAFGEKITRSRISDQMHISCLKNGVAQALTVKSILDLGGISVSSITAEFDFQKGVLSQDPKFDCGDGTRFSHWLPHVDPAPNVKIKPMKKWDRMSVRFPQIDLPAAALPIFHEMVAKCQCPSGTLKPVTGPMMHFQCFVCGQSYICECFRGIAERCSSRPNYQTAPFEELLASTPYREDTCHLCRGVPSTTGNRQHGQSEVRAYYWRYISDFAHGTARNWREAENLVRDRLGVPRIGEGWLAEANLLRIVQALYPQYEVLHQASPDWLGRQRFDIFIPELSLAIEYNGQQHYAPIEHFGGQRGFEATQQRDHDKRDKAAEAGVALVEFRYDENLSPEHVAQRICARLEKTK
jgi:hypothetical protein